MSLFGVIASSKQSVFNPLSVAGCKLWLKADVGITKDGGDLVSNWADQSGNSNDLAQATGTNQPLWVDSAHASKPTIRFDGVDNFLQIQPFATGSHTQPVTIFIVCTIPSDSGGNRMIYMAGTVGGATRCQFYTNGTPKYGIYAGSAEVFSAEAPSTALAYFTVKYNGASSEVRRNTTQIISGNPGANNPNGMTLASQDAGADFANIDICEVLFYDASITGTDLTDIETYLAGRWGL